MRILALEPYYGGSHQAFLDGWSQAGRHEWTLMTLPAYKWKWRMRHGAVTFADELHARFAPGTEREPPADANVRVAPPDLLLCSDMLNLAEFLGLAPRRLRDLPGIIYFHENQLTYPVRHEDERDYQFAITNMTSALAADAVWFNSAFHRDSFLQALESLLRRTPDYQPLDAIARIAAKSQVFPPGVAPLSEGPLRRPGPCEEPQGRQGPRGPIRLLWAARWEHDKNPEEFFEAVRLLKNRQIAFRLSVVGEQFRDAPGAFAQARRDFAEHIDRWGYQPARAAYEAALREADVFVSTAVHEFFGLSAVEAVLAGAYPLLPRRLSYPEIFDPGNENSTGSFFYAGGPAALADRLAELAGRLQAGHSLVQATEPLRARLRRFEWPKLAPLLDDAAEALCRNRLPEL